MKLRSVTLICLAEIAAMGLWFVSAAVLPEMTAEAGLSEGQGAALSSAVQIGFVIGALSFAIFGVADRLDPRSHANGWPGAMGHADDLRRSF